VPERVLWPIFDAETGHAGEAVKFADREGSARRGDAQPCASRYVLLPRGYSVSRGSPSLLSFSNGHTRRKPGRSIGSGFTTTPPFWRIPILFSARSAIRRIVTIGSQSARHRARDGGGRRVFRANVSAAKRAARVPCCCYRGPFPVSLAAIAWTWILRLDVQA